MRVLITGMAGLIGSHLSRYLRSKGHYVVGIDDFSGGYRDFVEKGTLCHEADLQNASLVNRIVALERPEVVYHLAAYAAEGLSPFIRRHNYANNVISSVNVINASLKHNVRKVIFTSSMAVYGNGPTPFDEDDPKCPIDPYGVAKLAVERDLELAGIQFGLEYSIVRPHNVIGIYQNIWDRYRNVIGIWIRQVLSGQPITIFGDGTQKRAFSDIQFYMSPFEKLLTHCDGMTVNIGADKAWTINDAAAVLMKVARRKGYTAEKVHLEARHEAHTAYCNHEKARQFLDFSDDTHLEATIDEMFTWAMKQPNRPVKTIPIEVEKDLYSFWRVDGSSHPVHTATTSVAGALS